MSDILSQALQIQDELIEARRYLHGTAEGGFDTARSGKYISERLAACGITPKPIGNGGITSTLGNGERCILLRADIDAVRQREGSGEPFASAGEYSHACGHDMHTAMLLGAAKILKRNENELKCTVKLLFQPAEELLLGAEDMIKGGIMERPRVTAALSVHVIPSLPLPVGSIFVPSPEVSAPAADFFEITVRGRASHGAAPHMSVDATAIGARILLSLEELVAKELSPTTASCITVGSLHSGSAANIISDKCTLSGSLRTLDDKAREMMKSRLKEISAGIAAVYGATAEVIFGGGAPTLKNSPEMCSLARKTLGEAIPSALTDVASMPSGERSLNGSEDFASFSHLVPSLLLAIAAGDPREGYAHPLH
ncbi:MAG: amidohydrolase, partial [Clostridia bacterium]|nr:amidohydrolase [Clostridia bacterium]